MFITFEGGEGTGKSTHIQRLAQDLEKMGHEVVSTREPGGNPSCEVLRNLVLHHQWEPLTEMLLFVASRHEHCKRVIEPALSQGKIVLCDRFMDSTVAYQGYGLGLSLDLLHTLHHHIVTAMPNLTFILDVDPIVGQMRIEKRSHNNHIDDRKIDFHTRVRQGLLRIAEDDPNRCMIIDATPPLDDVYDMLKKSVLEKLLNHTSEFKEMPC